MIDYKYYEYDGMDPGLEEVDAAYDGTEFEYDDFGERIGADELDDSEAADIAGEEDISAARAIEDGFRETINAENADLEDQMDDPELHEAATSDYPTGLPRR
jgi:hypothetical protein